MVSLLNGLSGLGAGLVSGLKPAVDEQMRLAMGGSAASGQQAALARVLGIPLINSTSAAPATAAPAADAAPAAPADATSAPAAPAAAADGKGATPALLAKAIYGQESGSGANTATSVTGARGGMQIEPATFRQYAKPGENIDNPAHNLAVGQRIIADLWEKSGGDPARVAVGYFSGPGNIAPPDSPTPWIKDRSDPTGKTVSGYVGDVLGRIKAMS